MKILPTSAESSYPWDSPTILKRSTVILGRKKTEPVTSTEKPIRHRNSGVEISAVFRHTYTASKLVLK
ncbi:hypothetical protein TNCV_1399211 [Trichonephila clavipes]|nr:hypothetical protein TNCV_1399211 [Trichonephila clavipes]